MILGLGVPEMMVILVVVLILFGPKNLPKLGTTLGQTVKNVREGMEEEATDEPAQTKPDAGKAKAASSSASTTETADTPEGEAAFCPHCGTRVSAEALFCPHCGTKLSEPEQEQEQAHAQEEHAQEQPAA